MTGSDRVVVVGGGLAGITAALNLAESGVPVVLVEARPWLGGATWSFGRRGLTIDNGQHVFLRCFTAYRELLDRLGVAESARLQARLDLTVLGPDGPARLRRSGLPAPTHLALPLARYRPLTPSQRFAVLPAAMTMWLSDLAGPGTEDASIGEWLRRHGQDEHAIRVFWDLFLRPFMNAPTAATDQGTAVAFINAALLSHRDQADLGISSVPLRELHAKPAGRRLAELGAEIRLGTQVTAVRCGDRGRFVVELDPGPSAPGEVPGQLTLGDEGQREIDAAGVVLAVPAWTAAGLLPGELAPAATGWSELRPAPVVSVHAIYDSRVMELPFVTTIGSPLRWITDKTRAAGLHTGQYLAASVPAARRLVDETPAAIRARMLPELARLFPAAAGAKVEDFFVTRERKATFVPAPGTRTVRPGPRTRLAGLALAGAWTDTGWPDTMEGAVRSGHRAAEVIRAARSARVRTADRAPVAAAVRSAVADADAALAAALEDTAPGIPVVRGDAPEAAPSAAESWAPQAAESVAAAAPAAEPEPVAEAAAEVAAGPGGSGELTAAEEPAATDKPVVPAQAARTDDSRSAEPRAKDGPPGGVLAAVPGHGEAEGPAASVPAQHRPRRKGRRPPTPAGAADDTGGRGQSAAHP